MGLGDGTDDAAGAATAGTGEPLQRGDPAEERGPAQPSWRPRARGIGAGWRRRALSGRQRDDDRAPRRLRGEGAVVPQERDARGGDQRGQPRQELERLEEPGDRPIGPGPAPLVSAVTPY